jgi:hypothetical protein
VATDRDAGDRSSARLKIIACLAIGLFFCLFFGWLLYWTAIPVADTLINRIGSLAAHDFVSFYAASRFAASGAPAQVYVLDAMRATIHSLAGGHDLTIPWSYPPHYLLLLTPLGFLSPQTGLWTWIGLHFAVVAAMTGVIVRNWRVAVFGALLPAAAHSVFYGQNGSLTAALLGLGLVAFDRSPVLTGVAWGLLSYKPHFALIPLSLAFALRRWATLTAMFFTIFALIGASVLVMGAETWRSFLGVLAWHARSAPDWYLDRSITAFGLARVAGAGIPFSLAIHATVALGAVAICIRVWRGTTDEAARAFSLATAALLFSPYGYEYDLAVLAVPFAYLIKAAIEARTLTWQTIILGGLLAIAPIASTIWAARTYVPITSIWLVGLIMLSVRMMAISPRRR